MGALAAGAIVVVQFPYSDLSGSKMRPAVVLAQASPSDWILCQITSNPYADPRAVELRQDDFAEGSLKIVSFARPGKLFTAHAILVRQEIGRLKNPVFEEILKKVVMTLRGKT
jgi:mRNA interferase MazF